MALSQAEWYAKLKTWYPKWFFENEENQAAHLQGLAAMLAQAHTDIEAHRDETFISLASGEFIDAQGLERQVIRLHGEFDAQYSQRVRNIGNQSNVPAIKRLVDLLLMVGECTILEDFDAARFCDSLTFCNRGDWLIDEIINTFNVIVDKQLHAPYSFLDREYFCDRSNYVGAVNSSQYVYNLITEAVGKAKALGTFYRVIERLE